MINEINFKNIIKDGISDPYYREDLKWYFICKRREAKKHFYTAEYFYTLLLYHAEDCKNNILTTYEKQKTYLQNCVNAASNNEFEPMQSYHGHCLDKTGITYEDYKKQYNDKQVIYYTEQLNNLKPLNILYLIEAEQILKKLKRNAEYSNKIRKKKNDSKYDYILN